MGMGRRKSLIQTTRLALAVVPQQLLPVDVVLLDVSNVEPTQPSGAWDLGTVRATFGPGFEDVDLVGLLHRHRGESVAVAGLDHGVERRDEVGLNRDTARALLIIVAVVVSIATRFEGQLFGLVLVFHRRTGASPQLGLRHMDKVWRESA